MNKKRIPAIALAKGRRQFGMCGLDHRASLDRGCP